MQWLSWGYIIFTLFYFHWGHTHSLHDNAGDAGIKQKKEKNTFSVGFKHKNTVFVEPDGQNAAEEQFSFWVKPVVK